MLVKQQILTDKFKNAIISTFFYFILIYKIGKKKKTIKKKTVKYLNTLFVESFPSTLFLS